MKVVARLILVGLVAFAQVACADGENTRREGEAPAHLKGVDYPDWVLKGSGAFGNEGEKIFFGVGSVSGIRNHALARTTADNRARAEIAKVFEVYSASLMKDYMASTTAGDMESSSEEQHVEQVVKTFSAQTLSGVQVVDHWFHPVDGTVYALGRLDLDSFTNQLEKMKELNGKVRDYVRKNAERAFMDLEQEEAKTN